MTPAEISLHDYIDRCIAGVEGQIFQLREELKAAQAVASDNVRSSLDAIDKRFDHVNQMQAAMADLQNRLLTKAEADARLAAIVTQLGQHQDALGRLRGGTATAGQVIMAGIALIGVGAAIVAVLFNLHTG